MAAAVGAVDLGSRVDELVVGRSADRAGQRAVEARPAGAALELGLARVELVAAAGAEESAGAVLVVERRAERALGRFLAQHRVLCRSQPAAPFGIAVGDLEGLGLGPAATGGEHRQSDSRAEPGERGTAGLRSIEHGCDPLSKAVSLG